MIRTRQSFIGTTMFLLGLCVTSMSARATTIIADIEIDYLNSGANPAFSTGYYGGSTVSFPVTLADSLNARDGDISTFVSLPTLSYITLGFSGGTVVDGAGNDLFLAETGSAAELADVFVSSDFGSTFTYLGVAFGNTVTEFDLASIGWAGAVNAVKVVGLDSNGGSPGFDLAYVEGLEGSVILPGPGSFFVFAIGLLLVAGRRLSR